MDSVHHLTKLTLYKANFGILYKDKKDKMWGLDVGALNVNSTIQPYIGGSMYWKISFKKKK